MIHPDKYGRQGLDRMRREEEGHLRRPYKKKGQDGGLVEILAGKKGPYLALLHVVARLATNRQRAIVGCFPELSATSGRIVTIEK